MLPSLPVDSHQILRWWNVSDFYHISGIQNLRRPPRHV